MDASLLLETLLKQFECFICFEYMHPPIKQCVTGHSMCDACSKKVKVCPTCAGTVKLNTRNFALEAIHDQVTFPCIYSESGCKIALSGKKITDHENVCIYEPKPCPFACIGSSLCQWKGIITDVIQHCKETHSTRTLINVFINKQKINKSIPEENKCDICRILNVFNKIFMFWLNRSCIGNYCIVRCSVFLISKAEKNEFSFEVKLENPKGQSNTLAGPCIQIGKVTHDTVSDEESSGNILYTVLGYSKQSMVTYSVKIFDDSVADNNKVSEELQSQDFSSNSYHSVHSDFSTSCDDSPDPET